MNTQLNVKKSTILEEVYEGAPNGPLSVFTVICQTDVDLAAAENVFKSMNLLTQRVPNTKIISATQPSDAKDSLRISLQVLFPQSPMSSIPKGKPW